MISYVLDTSVVLKWYNQKDEKYVDKALSLLNDLKNERVNVIVPNLLMIELVNVFIKGKHLSADNIRELTSSFFSLPVINKEPTEGIISRIPEICYKYGLTAYDSLYLATAYEENCQLISADNKGHGKVIDGTVIMLEDYKSGR